MKRSWTRGEKLLLATPLLVGLLIAVALWGPSVARDAARRATGAPQQWMTTPDAMIRSMALAGNGEILAAGNVITDKNGWKRGSGTVYLWNARTGAPLKPFAPVYTRRKTGASRDGFDIYALALSPDAISIGFARATDNWELYDVKTRRKLWRFSQFIEDAEFSRDGKIIALSSGYDDNSIYIVDAKTGRVRVRWKRQGSSNSRHIALSPDGQWLASIGPAGSPDWSAPYKPANPILLHRVSDGKLVRSISTGQGLAGETVASVAFSPDGKQLVSASSLNRYSDEDLTKFAPLHCYDAGTRRLQWQVGASAVGGADNRHIHFCDAVFSPDGRAIAAYQYVAGRVLLLDSATGATKQTRSLAGGTAASFFVPPGLAFAPDGKRLFVRGKNAVLHWDLE